VSVSCDNSCGWLCPPLCAVTRFRTSELCFSLILESDYEKYKKKSLCRRFVFVLANLQV